MTIDIFEDKDPEQALVHIHGDYKLFDLYSEEEDYAEETAKMTRKVAQHCFTYPLYIHFEAYDDCIDDVMKYHHTFEITHQLAGRTVLTMTDKKTYKAEVPSFTVKTDDYQAFQQACDLWFQFACDNSMWMVTQTAELAYENGFASIHLKPNTVVLLPGHDGQILSLITNDATFQSVENLRSIFDV